MAAFFRAVQTESVAGPLRREFMPKVWTAEHARLGEDADDSNLHLVGLLIHEKANAVRSAIQVAFSKTLNATTKLRAFVAVANHNLLVLEDKTHDAFVKKMEGTGTLFQPDLASIKLLLPVGENYSPDEIVQSMVDGSEVAIKAILEKQPDLLGNPRFAGVDWNDVMADFNLGAMYSILEGLWDDCLWNDYRVQQLEEGNVFAPKDPVWQNRRIASIYRQNNLTFQFFDIASTVLEGMGEAEVHARIGVRDVKSVTKNGRNQVIHLASSMPTEDGIRLLAARIYASEPYYADLLQEPQPAISGASLNDLLSAWTVVGRTTAIMHDDLKNLPPLSEDVKPNAWLPRFAPVLQPEALTRAIAGAVSIEFSRAKAIVEFLTFRGAIGQELWAQPLVPTNPHNVTPFLAATTSPNLRRLVDVWMKQLNVDLGRRGPAFEAYVRTTMRQHIDSSPLLKQSKLIANDFTFRPAEGREEQMDMVLVIGDLVIIGEAKCVLQPTEAKQYAMHRKTVTDAAAQVKRKASSVEKHSVEFRTQLHKQDIELSEVFRVLPVVLLNGPIHVGFEVDGVPIADMHIFSVFFSGELVDVALRNAEGGMAHIEKRILYSHPDEAASIAPAYFCAPPQMEILNAGMQHRWGPLPKISDRDWAGQYLTFDCIPEMQHIKDMVEGSVEAKGSTTAT